MACFSASDDTDNNQNPEVKKTDITGTAVFEKAVSGTITIKDSTGTIIESTLSSGQEGKFSIDASKLTGPFLLKAHDTKSNTNLFSFGETYGNINITPVTNTVLSLATGGDPSTINMDNGIVVTINSEAIKKAKSVLVTILQKLYENNTAITAKLNGFDPMASAFSADNTGLDKVLDQIELDISHASDNKISISVVNKSVEIDIKYIADLSSRDFSSLQGLLSSSDKRLLINVRIDGETIICTRFLNGKNYTELARSDQYCKGASWSSDGTKIIYSLRDDDKIKDFMYIMNADGSQKIKLDKESEFIYTPSSSNYSHSPCFSYNDEIIMFSNRSYIYLVDKRNESPHNVSKDIISLACKPTLSPVENTLVFSGDEKSEGFISYDLYKATYSENDGSLSNLVKLTNTDYDEIDAVVSWTGKKIAYVYNRTRAHSGDRYRLMAYYDDKFCNYLSWSSRFFYINWLHSDDKIIFTHTSSSGHTLYLYDSGNHEKSTIREIKGSVQSISIEP